MKMFFLIFFLFTSVHLYSQKPVIDSSTFNRWPYYRSVDITNDGKYCSFVVSRLLGDKMNLIIKGTDDHFQLQFISANEFAFTADSRKALFRLGNDSLCIVTLGQKEIRYIPKVEGYKLTSGSSPEYLAYQLKDAQKELVLLNLETGAENHFVNILDYQFNDQGTVLLLSKNAFQNGENILEWYDMANHSSKLIWEGKEAENFVFDNVGNQLAFIACADNNTQKELWYYEKKADQAICIKDERQVLSHMNPVSIKGFNYNGRRIYFYIDTPLLVSKHTVVISGVNVWSYKDLKLQSQQLHDLSRPTRQFACVLNVQTKKTTRLEQSGENLNFPSGKLFHVYNDDYLLLRVSGGGDIQDEWSWNTAATVALYLISTKDGSKRCVGKNLWFRVANTYSLSPDAKHLVYYNPEQKSYLCYAVASGTISNITKNIPAVWTSLFCDDEPTSLLNPIGIGAWGENQQSIYLYSQYDIFKVDLETKLPPINITNEYGKKHNIVFRFLKDDQQDLLKYKQDILLGAFNLRSMDDGFFSVNEEKNFRKLTTQPYLFSGLPEVASVIGATVIKAKNADVYLIKRSNSSEFPNFFLTREFRNFAQQTNIYPEKNYNWINSELITWNISETKLGEGILYKPENFDSNKKYPIIFSYYERNTEKLHEYIVPELSNANINIPFYVSNGYLVFVPDIHYQIGHPGRSAYNAIVSASKFLSKMSWVDSKKIGLQGHSFGGFETNYIIAHSKRFAAAVSAAGMSDFVSAYLSIVLRDGTSRQRQYELYRDRIGATLWERTNLYLENSPVLKAQNVSTPTLIMANEQDDDVPYQQGLEFFTALRRLQKKAWMLQYDNEGHSLVKRNSAVDFTIRMKQFFDHLLKNAPPPIWMTQGIPAKLKGIETGYAYDPSGNCGKDCKVCKYWNEKMKKDSVGTMKEIERRKVEEHWE